jgi:hypothetical protein
VGLEVEKMVNRVSEVKEAGTKECINYKVKAKSLQQNECTRGGSGRM